MPRYAPDKNAKCGNCEKTEKLKTGWNNQAFCSEQCERTVISSLHNSMPGGPSPYNGWLPSHVSKEISNRWED